MSRRLSLPLLVLAVVVGCSTQSETQPEPAPGALPPGTTLGDGAVSGRVTYAGKVTPPEPISMQSDANCHRKQEGTPHKQDLLVGPEGGLRNVYIHVASGVEEVFAPPESPATLDQRGCLYVPHVLGVQVGQPVRIVNSDPTIHNVHSISEGTDPFNFAMSVEGQTSTRYFHAPEVMVKLKCDVHPWMSAYVGVAPHPFFDVTDANGRFDLSGLPAGRYVIEAWHETLGTVTREVDVTDDAPRVEIALEFPE